MPKQGYFFYMDNMLLPITPPSMKISVGSHNKTVTLINDGEINILKSPSLIDISFTARFPMTKFPYSRTVNSFQSYFNKIKELKTNKTPFQFIVIRHGENKIPTWDTDLTVALESFTLKEDHEYGTDVLIDFKLKQYKNFGVKYVGKTSYASGNDSSNRATKVPKQEVVTTSEEDNAYLLSKKQYGDGALWFNVVGANSETLNPNKTLLTDVPQNSIYMPENTKVVLPSKQEQKGQYSYYGVENTHRSASDAEFNIKE